MILGDKYRIHVSRQTAWRDVTVGLDRRWAHRPECPDIDNRPDRKDARLNFTREVAPWVPPDYLLFSDEKIFGAGDFREGMYVKLGERPVGRPKVKTHQPTSGGALASG